MPVDFVPTDSHRELANELGVNLDQSFEASCDYHTSKGNTFVDWNRAFNTWRRNERKFARKERGRGEYDNRAERRQSSNITAANQAIQIANVEWRTEQLVVLAKVMKEPLTPQCLVIFIESLADLSDDQLRRAIFRAVRELEWFPKPAKISELAGAGAIDIKDAEAEAAWESVNEYLRKWGVARLPLYSGGQRIEAPDLPHRVDYALRAIGGLWALNEVTCESRPFVKKDFVAAYNLSPMADQQARQLQDGLRDQGLGSRLTRSLHRENPVQTKPAGFEVPIKNVPQLLTDVQLRDRREILRQQNALLMAKHQGTSLEKRQQAGFGRDKEK